MNKESFLLKLLASIFALQAVTFTVGLLWCGQHKGLEACPNIGERYEQTFNVMVATTLALLTGTALSNKGE